MCWNEVPFAEDLPKKLEEWKKIWHLFPPSFYDVYVMRGKRKFRAHFDAPNRRWVQSTKDYFNSPIMKQVKYWKEIELYTIEFQRTELDDHLDRRESAEDYGKKNAN